MTENTTNQHPTKEHINTTAVTLERDKSACSICTSSNPRKLGVRCHSCTKYFHICCAKLSKSAARCLTSWLCQSCLFHRPEGHGRSEKSSIPTEDAANSLIYVPRLRKSTKIPLKIPKRARISAASCLSSLIEDVLRKNDNSSWLKFISFAPLALGVPTESKNLCSEIRRNSERLSQSKPEATDFPPLDADPQLPYYDNISERVNRKLREGDVRAALRVLSSDDTILPPTPEVVRKLESRHPSPPPDYRDFSLPSNLPTITVTEDEVKDCISSFAPSSSGGLDGLRPGHIKDLTSADTSEAGRGLIKSITSLVNRLMNGDIPPYARNLLFCGHLLAFRKNDGGVRLIAIGNYFRRLSAKIAAKRMSPSLGAELSPHQVGVGVPNGCEAAVHASRVFFSQSDTESPCIGLRLDITNAFNSQRRDKILEVCCRRNIL